MACSEQPRDQPADGVANQNHRVVELERGEQGVGLVGAGNTITASALLPDRKTCSPPATDVDQSAG